DLERPGALDAALALARVAGVLHDLAVALAPRASRDVDHLAQHRLADAPDLAPAVALRAGDRLRAGLRAVAAARLAARKDRELDLLGRAEDGLLERDPEVVAEVGAGRRPAASTGPGRGGAEERVEDVGEAAREAARALGADGAEHVVALPALRVGQDLVRLVDLLEPRGRRGILVDVRVPALGEPPVRLLDVGVGGGPLDAEGLVVVADGHRSRSLRSIRPALSGGAAYDAGHADPTPDRRPELRS